MAQLKIYKETSLPGSLQANAVYIIRTGAGPTYTCRWIVTDSSGNAVEEDSVTAAQMASQIADAKARANHTGTQTASTISDFNSAADARITAQKGAVSGIAPLNSSQKIDATYLPDSILGQVRYQGVYDASGGTAPASASASTGHYYVISVAGTISSISYAVGDWIISNGTAWEKVDNSDAVTTVFGRNGNIVADGGDYEDHYVRHDAAQVLGDGATQARENIEAAGLGDDNTFTGANAFSQNIEMADTPTDPTHLVTKEYVDGEIAGVAASALVWTSTNW